jgi:hypothetical protein
MSVGSGPRPPLSDNRAAEDGCSTVWLLVRGRVPARVWVPARSWKASEALAKGSLIPRAQRAIPVW